LIYQTWCYFSRYTGQSIQRYQQINHVLIWTDQIKVKCTKWNIITLVHEKNSR
jgi:hypothetical protein